LSKKNLHEMTLDELLDIGVGPAGNTRHLVELGKLKRWQAEKVKNCQNKALVIIRPGEWDWEECGSVDYYGVKSYCAACRARRADFRLKAEDLTAQEKTGLEMKDL
jgi:hypothetical protein